MAKNNKQNNTKNVTAAADDNVKIVTKYDRKMQKRKEEERKAARNKKIAIGTFWALAAIVVIIVAVNIWSNYDKVHNEYISVDDDKISGIEFDFYYAMTKQNTLSQTLYGSMTYADYFKSYMSYDKDKDDSKQKYASTDNTWYDYFANMTVNTIKEDKALLKAADAAGFSYDNADSDYEDFKNQINDAASQLGESAADYYKNTFGKNASESSIKEYVCEYLKAAAYQKQLQTELAATDSEIKEYYNEHKESYDTVDYREFKIAAANSDDSSMAAAKEKAETMLSEINSEDTFAESCRKYATDDEKDTYESNDASLKSKTKKSSADNVIADWLFDSDRKAGDITVIEDKDNNQYYVVYFISRDYDSSNDTTIGQTVLSNKYSELIKGYTDNMKVDNKKNRIKMYTGE